MSYITQIDKGQLKTRKQHQCFHCYHPIPKGALSNFQSNICDGRAYTLYTHTDCDALWDEYFSDSGLSYWDYDDGTPPLHDEWCDSGEFENLCDAYRGHFPHVVCRMELSEQRAAIRLGEEIYG